MKVKDLQELEAKTEVVEINVNDPRSRDLIREYVDSNSQNTFNDFLASKIQDLYPSKIIVAEITGAPFGADQDEGCSLGATNEMDDYSMPVNGGDFSGCRFTNIEMHSFENVSFRDCHFENVRMVSSDLKDVDFRGASLEECEFFQFSEDLTLDNVRLPFSNPNLVGTKGVYDLYDDSKYAHACHVFESWLDKQEQIAIADIPKVKREKTWGEYFGDMALRGGMRRRKEEKYYEYDEAGLARIKAIKAANRKKKEEKFKELKERSRVKFSHPVCDPTYTVNQSRDIASQNRVYVVATKAMLADYRKSNKKKSFNDFVADIYRAQDPAAYEHSRLIAEFAGADLSNEDFSNLDLRGVNFSYSILEGTKFEKANLQGASLEGCRFNDKTSFHRADLSDANMVTVTGEGVNFKDAIMIRTRMHCVQLPRANFQEAQMYAVNGFRADFFGANMQAVDARRSKLKGAILQSVDARNANMERANLENAVLRDANLAKANLKHAVMTKVNGEGADLTNAILEEVRAEFSIFRKATLKNIVAKKANFTEADLQEANLQGAEFRDAILERVNARLADFTRTILENAKAARADFTEASLEKVKGQRVDLKAATLTRVRAEGSDFTNAIMTQVEAYRADFQRAILTGANLEGSNFTAVDFEQARLDHVKALNTKFVKTNFENANVQYIEINSETLLLDANLRGAVDAEQMRALQEEQHKLQRQWFGRSKYGYCKSNPDGSNDRFKCQRIGAAVLSAAIGGSTGLTLAGPFAGVGTAAVSAFISDKALLAIKQGYYDELGYVNNQVGDKLAEIGAVAMAAGVNGIDRAIDGAAAGMICGAAGAVTGVVATGVGVASVLKGAQLMWSGYQNQSRWQKFVGATVALVGTGLSFFGLSSLGASLSTVAHGAMFGAAAGAMYTVYTSVKSLVSYEEKDGKVVSGLRPEQIYRSSLLQLDAIKQKLMPTIRKFIVSITLCVTAIGVASFGVEIAMAAVGGALAAKVTIGGPIIITAAAAGLVGGYLYDNKVVDALLYIPKRLMPDIKKESSQYSEGGGVGLQQDPILQEKQEKTEEPSIVGKDTKVQAQPSGAEDHSHSGLGGKVSAVQSVDTSLKPNVSTKTQHYWSEKIVGDGSSKVKSRSNGKKLKLKRVSRQQKVSSQRKHSYRSKEIKRRQEKVEGRSKS